MVLTREQDTTVGLHDRVDAAESVENSVFISIHANSAPSELTKGIEFYIPQTSHPMAASSEKLAKLLHAKFGDAGFKVRSIKSANFYVLKNAAVPTVLIETGFMSNPKDLESLLNPSYQDQLVNEIVTSIQLYKDAN